jgi:sulfite reductase alpha subunit-like flavoprotein
MTCPGGCIGGGGLPQSRDPLVLQKRTDSIYSMDERMVKRKSHENHAVMRLYEEYLGEPLSHLSHELLHTHYEARPRKAPVLLKAGDSSASSVDLDSGDDANNIYIVYGTQSGTAAQAAKDIKMELQQVIARSKLNPEPQVCLVAGNALPPDALAERIRGSKASIFVTCTYGEGEMPDMANKLWEHLQASDNDGLLSESGTKYAVFGLCSSRYDVGDQYNRAARYFDERLEEMGGERMVEVGVGDDQNSEGYRGALDPWLEQLQPQLFAGGTSKTSLLDPPDPLFRISLAPGSHGKDFQPLPPEHHFITLKSTKSLVSQGYNRPAGLFSFSLDDTGLEYKVGDHLSILPRNPEPVVQDVLSMYGSAVHGSQLVTVEAVDPHGECPYPKVLSIEELLTQYLDLCGRPARSFFKQLSMFANNDETRLKLRSFYERDTELSMPQEDFDLYTDQHTYADVLKEFQESSLPPFEYLLSMIPNITPRYYSIASSPLANETQLDLLVVLNDWKDSAKKHRFGLNTQYLFRSKPGDKFAVQVHEGMLIPPDVDDLDTPVVMFSLGAGLAPFVGFVQHRQALLKKLNDMKEEGEEPKQMGPATLYFGSRHRAHEYYMEDYFEQAIQEGALTAIHTAFSRDDPTGKKHYVYDAISDNPKAFAEALQITAGEEDGENKADKARCYYCGSANGIPEAIQESMKKALTSEEGAAMKEEDAHEYMDRLVNKDKRFHAECF